MAPVGPGGMVAVELFEFIRASVDVLFALTFLDRRELFTVGIGIAMLDSDSILLAGELATYW